MGTLYDDWFLEPLKERWLIAVQLLPSLGEKNYSGY